MEHTASFERHKARIDDMFEGDTRLAEHWTSLTWFADYSWDELARANVELRGYSFKCSQSGTLLTVRAVVDGRPCVSFLSGVSIGDCLRMLYRQLETWGLRWSDDKFA